MSGCAAVLKRLSKADRLVAVQVNRAKTTAAVPRVEAWNLTHALKS